MVGAAARGQRLDIVLGAELPGALGRDLSRSAVRRLVMAGVVRVNGIVTRRPGLELDAGDRIDARVDVRRLALPGEQAEARLSAADILFEDEDLIAVAKPPGISTHAGADPRRQDMVTLVRAWLASRTGRAGRDGALPYLAVHQRLDRETSGVLLFAKTMRVNAALADVFAGRRATKTYHALTVPPRKATRDAWTIESRLGSVGTGRASRMTATPEGLAATTAVRILERHPHGWLVEACPGTGRRHQVRAHLADAGLPIRGDVRYGAPSTGQFAAPRVMLHCSRLALPHPLDGHALEIGCPWPADFTRAQEGR